MRNEGINSCTLASPRIETKVEMALNQMNNISDDIQCKLDELRERLRVVLNPNSLPIHVSLLMVKQKLIMAIVNL